MFLLGPIATPDKIQIVNGLPKTRSGKIMRRILRKIVEGELENLGDLSTCTFFILFYILLIKNKLIIKIYISGRPNHRLVYNRW
jgi:hypothetical protein